MAKDRRDREDRELARGLQEVETTPPRRTAPEQLEPAEEVEPRMMFAVEMLQTLPEREQLAVIGALLPGLLEELDVAGRSNFLDVLIARAGMRQLS